MAKSDQDILTEQLGNLTPLAEGRKKSTEEKNWHIIRSHSMANSSNPYGALQDTRQEADSKSDAFAKKALSQGHGRKVALLAHKAHQAVRTHKHQLNHMISKTAEEHGISQAEHKRRLIKKSHDHVRAEGVFSGLNRHDPTYEIIPGDDGRGDRMVFHPLPAHKFKK